MRKITVVVAVLGACLAWSFLSYAPVVGQERGRGGPGGQTPFAGTFLAEIDFGPLGILQSTLQLHTDGTAWAFDQSDYGFGGILDLDSPQMGSWKRTGPHQTTAVNLSCNFDSADGSPTTVTRLTHVMDWERGFDTLSAEATLRVYDTAEGEDPLDPTQGEDGPVVNWTARRLVP